MRVVSLLALFLLAACGTPTAPAADQLTPSLVLASGETVAFAADCRSLTCTLTVTVTPSAAVDYVRWNFGDGDYLVRQQTFIRHKYPASGSYSAWAQPVFADGSYLSATLLTVVVP